MSQLHYKRLFYRCLLLVSANLAGSLACAVQPAPPTLPVWQILDFEQQAFWATARSQIEVQPVPGDEQRWQLTAASSVASNSEQVQLTLAARDGHAIRRTRLSKGKDQRYKFFDYQADHILRERRNPGADKDQLPTEWAVSSRREIDYPAHGKGMAITDAYALLVIAGRFQAGSKESAEVVIHTDFNFYRVQMTRSPGAPITVDYQIAGSDQATTGMRDTHAVILQASPLGTLAEKPDFSLLGLYGRITLLFDDESGLPVQLRGTAPRLGPVEINLKSATLREPQG